MADSTVKPDDTNDLVLQNNHGDSKIEINEDDTIVVTSGGDATIDATGDIILDAGGADVKLKDGGVQFGTLKQASTHLVIQPESSKEIIFNDGSGTASLTVDAANQNVSINNGSIVISTAGQGITFGGDPDSRVNSPTVRGRTLYDYETGLWTPFVDTSGTSGTANVTYAWQSGTYTKIGNLVTCIGYIQFGAPSPAIVPGTGNLVVGGFPYTSGTGSGYTGGSGVVHWYNVFINNGPHLAAMNLGTSTATLRRYASDTATDTAQISAMSGNSSQFGFTIQYEADYNLP